MEEKKKISSRLTRNKHALGITTAVVILILTCAISVAVTSVIKSYVAYSTVAMQREALAYATKNGMYTEITYSDNSAMGFNINAGSKPSTLVSSNSVYSNTVIIKPRYASQEYYKYPNGAIVTPYSLENVQAY